ncbi:MAG: DUF5606 domain-containing protein [Flavobacteriales bacterium]|nr:DUF5606 domain-containing protein [Flavobacteriales bacterium]
MNLKSIISVTGKPGLFKVVSQTKSGFIVESLADGKKLPVYASDKVSALEDISIYTTTEDMPLLEVYGKLYESTKGKEAVDHNSKPEELRAYLAKVVDFDQERVYNSDLKKLFMWFNIMIKSDFFKQQEAEPKKAEKGVDTKDTKKKVTDKKVTTKKPTTAKPVAKKPSAAKATVKKAAGSKKNG